MKESRAMMTRKTVHIVRPYGTELMSVNTYNGSGVNNPPFVSRKLSRLDWIRYRITLERNATVIVKKGKITQYEEWVPA